MNVTVTVPNNLAIPKLTVGFWAFVAPGAAVPETSVHEERQPVLPKNKIRFAEYFLIPPPSGYASGI
jgi:hypothetical protein